jgi:hypothetical protein
MDDDNRKLAIVTTGEHAGRLVLVPVNLGDYSVYPCTLLKPDESLPGGMVKDKVIALLASSFRLVE